VFSPLVPCLGPCFCVPRFSGRAHAGTPSGAQNPGTPPLSANNFPVVLKDRGELSVVCPPWAAQASCYAHYGGATTAFPPPPPPPPPPFPLPPNIDPIDLGGERGGGVRFAAFRKALRCAAAGPNLSALLFVFPSRHAYYAMADALDGASSEFRINTFPRTFRRTCPQKRLSRI
jgi:hypothetical protein